MSYCCASLKAFGADWQANSMSDQCVASSLILMQFCNWFQLLWQSTTDSVSPREIMPFWFLTWILLLTRGLWYCLSCGWKPSFVLLVKADHKTILWNMARPFWFALCVSIVVSCFSSCFDLTVMMCFFCVVFFQWTQWSPLCQQFLQVMGIHSCVLCFTDVSRTVLLCNRFCILAYSYKIVCVLWLCEHALFCLDFLYVSYIINVHSAIHSLRLGTLPIFKKSGRHLFKLIRARQDIGTEMCDGFDFWWCEAKCLFLLRVPRQDHMELTYYYSNLHVINSEHRLL